MEGKGKWVKVWVSSFKCDVCKKETYENNNPGAVGFPVLTWNKKLKNWDSEPKQLCQECTWNLKWKRVR